MEQSPTSISSEWIDTYASLIPRRTVESHKYLNGYLTALVGSRSFPGAARLCTHAAARVGAGGVQVLLPESLWPLVGSFPAEIMPILLKEHGGNVAPLAAFETFLEVSERSKALLVGCGLGRTPGIQELIKSILSHTQLPMVIDGDGLYALGKWGREFIHHHSKGQWILTPHQGELRRLRADLGYDNADQDEESVNIEALTNMCRELRVVIVAKGFPSLVFTPHDGVHINETGNPAATTAGCGDVLAGMIAGYLTQGLRADKAARLGLYQAGRAADSFIARTGSHSLMASDILHELSKY